MLMNDLLITVIYFVLIGVIAGVGYSLIPKELKQLIKKILLLVYKKVFTGGKPKKKKE